MHYLNIINPPPRLLPLLHPNVLGLYKLPKCLLLDTVLMMHRPPIPP